MEVIHRFKIKKTTLLLILFSVAFCELRAAPVRRASRQHQTHKAGKSHVEEWVSSVIHKVRPLSSDTSAKYLASRRPCRLRILYTATLAELNLGQVFLAPQSPITWAYCDGSCEPPFSIDDRNRDYATNDNVLLRQMADLSNIAISNRKKKKFKTPCCVPVGYTGLWLATMRNGKLKWDLWRYAIPSRCGCR